MKKRAGNLTIEAIKPEVARLMAAQSLRRRRASEIKSINPADERAMRMAQQASQNMERMNALIVATMGQLYQMFSGSSAFTDQQTHIMAKDAYEALATVQQEFKLADRKLSATIQHLDRKLSGR